MNKSAKTQCAKPWDIPDTRLDKDVVKEIIADGTLAERRQLIQKKIQFYQNAELVEQMHKN